MTYIVGIDPGLTGALAFLNPDGTFLTLFDMPVMPNGKGKAKVQNQINSAAVAQIFRRADIPMRDMCGIIEQVQAMTKQGVSSVFSFGDTYGALRTVPAVLGIPLTHVRPQAWKKRFGLIGADKDKSLPIAQGLFPTAELHLKKHHNRADALLIARYGWEQMRTL